MSLDALGYRSLLALLLVLPFDPSRYPAVTIAGAEITPPDLLLLLVGLLAALSLAVRAGKVMDNGRGWLRYGVAAALLAALLVSMVVTSIRAGDLVTTTVWLLNIAAGGCIALALPAWLDSNRESRMAALAAALVAGAVVAALVGFGEFLIGSPLERALTAFRPGPTTMGPFTRLTSVFHHANLAAMYFEIALPFAVAGLIAAARRKRDTGNRRWLLRLALWGAAVNILLLALLLTYTRGAVLGLLAAGGVCAVAVRSLRPVRWAGGRGRLLRPGARWSLIAGANLALLFGLFLATTSSIEAVRLTSTTDEGWYRVSFVGSPPPVMRPGSQVPVRVTVGNLSPLAWKSGRQGDYALSYHWLYPSYRVARFDTTLTALPLVVPPGSRRTVTAGVWAPPRPGEYILIWDVLWRGSTWFDLKTGDLVPHPVRLTGPLVTARPAGGFSQAGDASLTYLPIDQAVDRQSIWLAGLRIFMRQPVLGGGLHAYFDGYGSVAQVGPGVRPPPHAHDLVLEFLDNWGLAGTTLLALLAAVLWLPLLGVAWRGRVTSARQVAVLAAGAAFLAHGTVDYFFGATSIFGAVWILTGLASVAGSAAISPSVIQKSSSTAREPSR